jgi:putative ABC transport system permease protein
LNDDSALQAYEPYRQVPQGAMNFVLRTSLPAASLAGTLRERVWSLDRDVPINQIFTMREVVAGSMAQPRFRTVLLGVFAGLALLLAAVGLYGVMAYNVTQRTHEIGLRMALGAQRGDVLKLVLCQGMTMTVLGVVVGIAGALALVRAMSQVMAQMLFGVQAMDPATFVAIPVVLLAVALLACLIPARRATRVDPLQALRYE